jgi:hypothetical protein
MKVAQQKSYSYYLKKLSLLGFFQIPQNSNHWYTDDSANLTFAELVLAELDFLFILPNRTTNSAKFAESPPVSRECLGFLSLVFRD